jgi:hypothetical protein
VLGIGYPGALVPRRRSTESILRVSRRRFCSLTVRVPATDPILPRSQGSCSDHTILDSRFPRDRRRLGNYSRLKNHPRLTHAFASSRVPKPESRLAVGTFPIPGCCNNHLQRVICVRAHALLAGCSVCSRMVRVTGVLHRPTACRLGVRLP